MANEVAIILKAVDKASGEINKVTTAGGKLSAGFKTLTGFSLGAAGGIAVAGTAIQATIDYMRKATDETVAYNASIIDMARFTGDEVDAMSRLVQVADDVFLSQEALNNAMSIGAKKGLDMSVAGILKLADTYNALGTVQEKNKLLNDNFGRSGLAVGKLLEIGSNGIRSNMAAINENMVVTQKSSAATIEYKQSLDRLQDSMAGIKYEVGNNLTPVMSDFNIVLAHFIESITTGREVTSGLSNSSQAVVDIFSNWADKIRAEVNPAIGEQIPLVKEDAESLVMLRNAQEDVNDVNKDATQYFKDLTAELIFNKLAAGMDEDAQMQLAMQMGLVNWETYATLGALDELTAKYDTNKDGVITLKEKTAEYNIELSKILGYQNALKDKTVTYTFAMIQKGSINNSDILPFPIKPGTATGAISSGGWTPVGERGPEVVDLPRGSRVYSNTESKQMGGGGMTQSDMSAMAKLFAVAVATEMQKANG